MPDLRQVKMFEKQNTPAMIELVSLLVCIMYKCKCGFHFSNTLTWWSTNKMLSLLNFCGMEKVWGHYFFFISWHFDTKSRKPTLLQCNIRVLDKVCIVSLSVMNNIYFIYKQSYSLQSIWKVSKLSIKWYWQVFMIFKGHNIC